jgi:hypothetical protein
MKLTFKNLQEQKMKWGPHGRNDHTWVFSYINDESKFVENNRIRGEIAHSKNPEITQVCEQCLES